MLTTIIHLYYHTSQAAVRFGIDKGNCAEAAQGISNALAYSELRGSNLPALTPCRKESLEKS